MQENCSGQRRNHHYFLFFNLTSPILRTSFAPFSPSHRDWYMRAKILHVSTPSCSLLSVWYAMHSVSKWNTCTYTPDCRNTCTTFTIVVCFRSEDLDCSAVVKLCPSLQKSFSRDTPTAAQNRALAIHK